MFTSRRFLAAWALLILSVSAAVAQKDEFDYRRFLTPPRTTPEFWEAMKFEMEVGRFDLAAQHLRDMIAKKPTPDELIKLHEKEGIVNFLRLRNVPKWTDERDKEKQARADVETLIDLVTEAVKAKLADPKRIATYVANLYGLPEEAAFARIELAKSGTAAIPYMIQELRRRDEKDRGPILDAMAEMGPDTVLPLLAALDIGDNVLRENLLDSLLKRRDLFSLPGRGINVAAAVWPLNSALNKNEFIKRKARAVLTVVTNVRSADYLPPAIVALTQEAERYYYHRVRFADPLKVAIWRWDGTKLFEDTSFNATKAEEFLGMRYARQALQIDPSYRPAQLVTLELRIDKGYQAPTPDRPLGTLKPTLEDLLLTLNVDLLKTALEQALTDERTPIALATIKALGKLGDVGALRAETQGEPALVRALYYGDRRVQFAAADAILRIPGSASVQAMTRIVEVLRWPLLPDLAVANRPRILVASANEVYLREASAAIRQAGYDEVLAFNGRQTVKRLLARNDIDAVLLDSTIAAPDLSWVLAQLRNDRGLRRLPILVAAIPESKEAREVLEELRDLQVRRKTLEAEIDNRLAELGRVAATNTFRLAREGRDLPLEDKRARKAKVDERIAFLSERYNQETEKREDQLRKHLEKLKHVWVVSSTSFTDARLLSARLDEHIRETGMAPLSKVERKEYVDTALAWLARMATGDVKGYDVKPAEDAVINMLTAPDLGEPSTLNVIRILGRLPGGGAQRQIIGVLVDAKRPVSLRVAAADELLRHLQEYGRPSPDSERYLRDTIQVELKQAGIDPALRDRLTRLVGALRPSERTTGQRLRDFGP